MWCCHCILETNRDKKLDSNFQEPPIFVIPSTLLHCDGASSLMRAKLKRFFWQRQTISVVFPWTGSFSGVNLTWQTLFVMLPLKQKQWTVQEERGGGCQEIFHQFSQSLNSLVSIVFWTILIVVLWGLTHSAWDCKWHRSYTPTSLILFCKRIVDHYMTGAQTCSVAPSDGNWDIMLTLNIW